MSESIRDFKLGSHAVDSEQQLSKSEHALFEHCRQGPPRLGYLHQHITEKFVSTIASRPVVLMSAKLLSVISSLALRDALT
jgi:hypothetical protein